MTIRLRLTAVFAAAFVMVMVAAGLFVYVRLAADLNDAIDAELRAQSGSLAAAVRRGGVAVAASTPLEDEEEGFVQVVDAQGRVLAVSGTVRGSAVSAGDVHAALAGRRVWADRDLPGVDGRARVLGRPVTVGGDVFVAVVGHSLRDRDEALGDVRNSFALGGPLAVGAASLVGYWLARLGLAPVEAMRRTAGDISASARRGGRRLPLPRADDEIRRLGATLNDMLERLEESFERERRFVSDASHELRTPVAVAKTELEASLQGGSYGPDAGAAMRAAVEELDSLGQLADDLLVVARGGEGGLDLLLEPVPVRPLLDGVRDRFVDRAAARGRAIAVVVDAEGIGGAAAAGLGGLVVRGDRARLRQALGNLVDNALRHGDGLVTLHAARYDGVVTLAVSDEGPGFGPDIAGRAFDRFARADEARGRAGAGLGLAIVRTLAEAHGGQAAIVDGGAATVRITLPA